MILKLSRIVLTGVFAVGVALSFSVSDSKAAGHGKAIDLGKMAVNDGLAKSLTGKAGDPKKGYATAIHRKKGNCLACHTFPAKGQADHGNIGPDLRGVASRYSEAELRLRIVDPKVVNEDTIMPSFYKTAGLHRVQKKWAGKTMLSAQEVEDIVAYLLTLKEEK